MSCEMEIQVPSPSLVSECQYSVGGFCVVFSNVVQPPPSDRKQPSQTVVQ